MQYVKPKINEMDTTQIVILVFVVVTVFMAGREIFNWYFKINERIKLQQETNELLKKLLSK